MPKENQDIDAGIERRSPGPREPHREHDPKDRGGVYVREQEQERVHPRKYEREEMERAIAPPSDPDDPVGGQAAGTQDTGGQGHAAKHKDAR